MKKEEYETKDSGKRMREFSSGATRDLDDTKIDYEGVMSPLVMEAFGKYMTKHRHTANGLRESDNWQKLFGDKHYDVCIKSAFRHFHDWWMEHDGFESRDGLDEALGGLMFNVQAYWFKKLLEKKDVDRMFRASEWLRNKLKGKK